MNSHKQNLNISRLFERIKVNLCKTGFSLFSPMTTLLTSDYSSSGGYSDGKEVGLLQIEDDGVIPPIIDLRICSPGAAKGYASQGTMMPYTPPSYAPVPMRIPRAVLAPRAF